MPKLTLKQVGNKVVLTWTYVAGFTLDFTLYDLDPVGGGGGGGGGGGTTGGQETSVETIPIDCTLWFNTTAGIYKNDVKTLPSAEKTIEFTANDTIKLKWTTTAPIGATVPCKICMDNSEGFVVSEFDFRRNK